MKSKSYNFCKTLLLGCILFVCAYFSACVKQNDWLNVKRQNSSVVPTTLQDLQAVLDDNPVMNANYPMTELAGTDNVLITDAALSAASFVERNSYTWAKDIFQGQNSSEWTNMYKNIEYANVVLDGVAAIKGADANTTTYNNIKGSALFYRSIFFYYLAQLYCKSYTASSASTDPGIPLRLNSDINLPSVRSTVQATYDQMISDLKVAISLLPVAPQVTTRPSQASATALLAKIYLIMENYTDAGAYANQSLQLYSTLLDYNSSLIIPTSTYRFPSFTPGNPEVMFYATGGGLKTLWPNGTGYVDSSLYKSYTANDLRKTLFFKDSGNGQVNFFGGYTGSAALDFAGIAVDEVYLIRAECFARAGNTSAAMTDLNTLLIKRWKTGTYIPYTAVSNTDALTQILKERRKEMPYTATIRWEDLRRLNKDSQYAVTINHKYNGVLYTLSPNDNRYIFPIPDQEVQLLGLQQNPR